MNPSIPYVNLAAQHLHIKDELLEAAARVIEEGRFVLGDELIEFERRFAQLCNVPYAVGVNSGTDALIIALEVLGIGPGDEVITAPNSFVATAGAIALVGARPVFVDVGEDYNIDPGMIQAAITERTKAILPVHLTGRPASMNPIMEISGAHGLAVIEDSAQAVLAEYHDRRVGSFGQIGCFSLHPLKTLNACGDGGVLTTSNAEVYQQLMVRRNLGLKTREECLLWARNSRLDNLQAALLLVKMKYVESWTERRRAKAARYQAGLGDIPQVKVPRDKPYERAVYHTFVIECEDREGLRSHLRKRGIGTNVHYPIPIHLQPAAQYLGHVAGSFPVTERQADRILSLPVYPELEDSELDYVIESVQGFYS